MKSCSTCKVAKPADQFSKASSRSDGLQANCKACDAEIKREYRRTHPDAQKAYIAKRVEENPDYHRELYLRHAEKVRARARKWNVDHPEQKSATGKAHYRSNTAQYKQRAAKYRARKFAQQVGDVDYELVIRRYHGRCHLCYKVCSPDELEIDHIIPISKGGPHSMRNLAVACRRCNRRKKDDENVYSGQYFGGAF